MQHAVKCTASEESLVEWSGEPHRSLTEQAAIGDASSSASQSRQQRQGSPGLSPQSRSRQRRQEHRRLTLPFDCRWTYLCRSGWDREVCRPSHLPAACVRASARRSLAGRAWSGCNSLVPSPLNPLVVSISLLVGVSGWPSLETVQLWVRQQQSTSVFLHSASLFQGYVQ